MQADQVAFALGEIPGIEDFVGEPTDIAFVSGSQQVGLGNSSSDYDLYIVYREGLDRLREGPKQFWLTEPHRRVDMERHSWQAIVAAAGAVNAVAEVTPEACGKLPFDALDLYFRTAVGRPMRNAESFAELTSRLDVDHYCRVFEAWSLWQSGMELAKSARMMETGRVEAAWSAGRLALRHAVTAKMAGLGYGWPNPKWAFVKLANHFGRGSEEFRRASAIGAESSVPKYLARVARYCIEHGAPDLDESPFAERIYAWRGQVIEVEIGGITYIVEAGRGVFEVDDAARFLCEQVDGKRTAGQIGARWSAHSGASAEDGMSQVRSLLLDLDAAGLVAVKEVAR